MHAITPLLSWLDEDVSRYWTVAWLAFGICVMLAWRPWVKNRLASRGGPAWFVLALAGCIMAFRWPVFFLPDHLNIDESQMISGAVTLWHDPVFWRAVEGQTIGPLDYYALMPVVALAGKNLYFGARLLAVLLAGATMAGGYFSARLFFSERVARASTLPLLAFFSFTTDANFVAYSSEYVPIALLALALLGVLKTGMGGGAGWAWGAGLALGAAPFAKLQCGPLAAWILICGGAWYWWGGQRGRWKTTLLPLWLGAVPVVVIIVGWALACGVARDMWISYFEANLFYTNANLDGPRLKVWREIFGVMVHNRSLAPLVASTLLLGGLALAVAKKGGGPRSWLLVIGGSSAVAGIVCALLGGRSYGHYFLLLAPGIGLVLAWALGTLEEWGRPPKRPWIRATALAALGAGLVWSAVAAGRGAGGFAGKFRAFQAMGDGPASAAIEELRRWVKPGEALAIWGWEPPLYLRTGAWQATRDPSTRRQVEPSAALAYFRERYLRDLEGNRPRVLVDATGAKRKGYGFDNFPEFRDYLANHYRIVAEVEERKIYVRHD